MRVKDFFKGNVDYAKKLISPDYDPELDALVVDYYFHDSLNNALLFDASSFFDLSKVSDVEKHFLKLFNRAFKKGVNILGDIYHNGFKNHFEALQDLAYKNSGLIDDYYHLNPFDNHVIVTPVNDGSEKLIVLRGSFQQYDLLRSNGSSVCFLTLGSDSFYNSIDDHLSIASDDNKLVIGFHWGTVPHDNAWYKYDLPSDSELRLLRDFASSNPDLVLACVSDSAFHMTIGNDITEKLASEFNLPLIWTSNAKNLINALGVSGAYVFGRFDVNNPVSSLKNNLKSSYYFNKPAYLNPVAWVFNTGLPQGFKPIVKNLFKKNQ